MVFPFSQSSPQYTITRRFYKKDAANSIRVEQSLDVYEPTRAIKEASDSNDTFSPQDERPTVILVMGSGWLGHQWWLYSMTNWWNASGPATIAKLGYRCISVRHSGGFIQLPVVSWTVLVGVLVTVTASHIAAMASGWSPSSPSVQGFVSWCMAAFFLLVSFWIFLKWQGRGSAQLDDMIDDVSDAIHFIHSDLGLEKTPVVLGGYSSGGHVVATLLSRHFNKLKDLPCHKNTDWIQGIFFLSGVMSLDSWLMNMVTLIVFGCWAKEVPSPYCGPPPPVHFKYLLVGCRDETFGFPVLDAVFCAKAYAEWLIRDCGIHARCELVDSNHWNVLASNALSKALEKQLPWFQDQQGGQHKAKTQERIISMASMASTNSIASSSGASVLEQ